MSGSYAILSQEACGDKTKYKVILKAEDGYQEEQEYVGDENTLEEAVNHFNEEWMKTLVKEEVSQAQEPEFIEA